MLMTAVAPTARYTQCGAKKSNLERKKGLNSGWQSKVQKRSVDRRRVLFLLSIISARLSLPQRERERDRTFISGLHYKTLEC